MSYHVDMVKFKGMEYQGELRLLHPTNILEI